eukprot:m.12497 g.12497  ORF g.12497 m.12497 type:complete len:725 (+) comp4271_c0_seq2:368-2542(+)
MAFRGIDRDVDREVFPPATDLTRWTLEVDEGRQTWRYMDEGEEQEKENPVASQYHVGLDVSADCPDLPPPESLNDALRNGIGFFSKLQTADGHWAGDYGGPMFLLPGLAIVTHVTGATLPDPVQREIVRYLSNRQTDGGWGIHIESEPTIFGTGLNYVVMRLLGVPRTDPRLIRARDWLKAHGGCIGIPSWGKFWLAILNVYSWDGLHSYFPEMVLLPQWFPLHTHRLWSYCRTVYMPMGFVYGERFQAPETDLIRELRQDLFCEPWDKIDWVAARGTVAPEDLYTPHTRTLKVFFSIVNTYERFRSSSLRQRALDWVYEVLRKEDEFTNYICIGPVNKVLNMLAVWIREGPESKPFAMHKERLRDYIWVGRDGAKMNGTNGSQLWDCSFLVQALIESGMHGEFRDVFDKANRYVDVTQIRQNHPNHKRYYRDETKGGWPFSTRAMGWIVADCTGEGLKAALICKSHGYTDTPLSDERLFDAVNILLLMQNATGGYATCEKTRGWHFFEWFNSSEVFGEIMIDYDYVECSSSALQALCLFRSLYPDHRAEEVTTAIEKCKRFIQSIQLPDGSWEGLWGICFTYGTWFGVEGLIDAGVAETDPKIKKACQFLLDHQQADGGWGETFMSCVNRRYEHHPRSQVVNTAWAVLTLLKARCPDQEAVRRGVKLILSRQEANGDWKQESICGVFNKNCMISYSNFKNIFPLWALGRFAEAYPDDPVLEAH